MAEILGRQLALALKASGVKRVDWVISSAYAAITFGHEVAKGLRARFMNVEKDPADPTGKRMLWRRITLPPGSRVLQIEELVTTLGTTQEVMHAVLEGNGEQVEFLPTIGTLVLRPPDLEAMKRGHRHCTCRERDLGKETRGVPALCRGFSPVQAKDPLGSTNWERIRRYLS